MTDDDGPSAAEAVDNLLSMAAHRRKLAVRREDFVAYLPAHNYIFMPTREPWPGSSVNAVLPAVQISKDKSIAASTWIDRNQAVEQMTWAPGQDELIHDRLISGGGWIERIGATCLNLYRPPMLTLGNATEAELWLDHVHKVFGEDDGQHIVTWLAQRVQHPQVKINHALVLGGPQGIGKDTLLEPVKRDRSLEFLRSFAATRTWAVQWVCKIRRSARERGARSRRA
jgi:hypothetical protein